MPQRERAIEAGADAFLRKPLDPLQLVSAVRDLLGTERAADQRDDTISWMTERLSSGSARLDDVLGGGLPANAINLVIGPPGSGKTILAEQYLFHNATEDRPGLFLSTVSEPFDKVLRYGESLSFFDRRRDRLTGVLRRPRQRPGRRTASPVWSIRSTACLKEFQPGLIVIDSFKAISAFAADEAEFRRFLHDLAGRLTAVAANSFWIGEYQRRATTEAAEFAVADAIIAMDTKRTAERETRVLQVLKLRGSGFMSGEHAYRVTASGISVFPGSPTCRTRPRTVPHARGTRRGSPRSTKRSATGTGKARPRWSPARPESARR